MEDDSTLLALLEKRVRQLESQVQSLADAQQRDVVVASCVRIVDGNGNTVVEVSGDMDGGHLHVMNGNGKLVASIGCSPTGSFLDLVSPRSGKLIVTVQSDGDVGLIETATHDSNTS